MVERNRFLSILTHVVLICGVLVVAFPVYLTFIASTHTTQEVLQVPMPLTPGSSIVDNYSAALSG
jgi:sn-glycerol 3-phosphate transport system permease protein